jgi:dolichyl-diphosphooligosaccharide--protein glycosyltransferase
VRPPLVAGCLFAAACLAVAVRSLNAFSVFVDGDVYLAMWDASYHARRALYSFLEFPRILWFDPYLAHPGGAPVPMPPLYDWLLAAVARVLGDEVSTFERVAAWWSPALATLTLVPIYGIARLLGREGAGIGGALLLALLPASAVVSRVGNPDHHAAVGLLVALYAASGARIVQRDTMRRRLVAAGAVLAAVRAALLLSWSGSLLYLAVGEAALLLLGLLAARPALLTSQALSALASGLAVAPWVAAAGTPPGAPFSSTTLSWLHVLALFALAAAAGGLASLERMRPARSAGLRLARAALCFAAPAGALLALPGARESLIPAFAFLTKSNPWGEVIVEQSALFSWMPGARGDRAARLYGAWAYAIPLAPLAYLWCARGRAGWEPRLLLAIWTAALGALAILQVRFGSDFAPLGCLGFALLLDALRRRLSARLGWLPALALACGLALALLWPALAKSYAWRVRQLATHLGDVEGLRDPVFFHESPTFVRFCKLVRSVTPETSGFLDPAQRPEYGILLKPPFGHAMHYAGRRATPADGFGPYLDAEKNRLVHRFMASRSENEAVRIAARLDARYVVTHDNHTLRPGDFLHLLQRLDGSQGDGAGHAEHFRLVAEAPAGAKVLSTSFPNGSPGPIVPYKLFERVEGALVEARAPPGTPFTLELMLQTNTGRRFRFRAATQTDAAARARLRVPYDTQGDGPTRALGPYRARLGERESAFSVRAHAVREGLVVPLEG